MTETKQERIERARQHYETRAQRRPTQRWDNLRRWWTRQLDGYELWDER